MFLKNRNVNPAGGVSNISPNVGQYGWTKVESGYYNQLLQYVDVSEKAAQRATDAAAYVQSKVVEVEEYVDTFSKLHDEIKPMYSNFLKLYQEILVIRAEVQRSLEISRNIEASVQERYGQISAMYEEILDMYNKLFPPLSVMKEGDYVLK